MVHTLLANKAYKKLMVSHCKEILEFFISRKITFSILCNVACVKFEPELPSEIASRFSTLTLFALEGYTFESVELDSENLYFEAGFGSENFGSFVSVPLSSVVQIFIQDKAVQGDFLAYVNWIASLLEPDTKKEEEGIEQSMQALLSNPNNQHLASKKRED